MKLMGKIFPVPCLWELLLRMRIIYYEMSAGQSKCLAMLLFDDLAVRRRRCEASEDAGWEDP